MRKVGRRRRKLLAIHRLFARSRHEIGFAAAAYELVVPVRKRGLVLPATICKRIDWRSPMQEQLVGRRA
jgi:hypothetical protein